MIKLPPPESHKRDSIVSCVISNLRFPLTLLVVCIHCVTIGSLLKLQDEGVLCYSMNRYEETVLYFIREEIARIAVPVFFSISGFLFFGGCKNFNLHIYLNKMRRRWYSLMIPFFIWNTLYMLYPFSVWIRQHAPLAEYFTNTQNKDVHFSFSSMLSSFWDQSLSPMVTIPASSVDVAPMYDVVAPLDGPLWYVRELFFISALSPLVYFVLKKVGWFLPLILFAFDVMLCDVHIGYFYQLNGAFCYFSIGALIAIRDVDIVRVCKNLNLVPFIHFLFFSLVHIITECPVFHRMMLPFGALTLLQLTVWVTLSGHKVSHCLLDHCFFIFAFHAILLGYVKAFILLVYIPVSGVEQFLLFFWCVAVTVLIAILTSITIRKMCPKVWFVLVGKVNSISIK